MICALKKVVNYIYHRSNAVSYIDHVFFPIHILDSVRRCEILQDESDNVSDHLPLSTVVNVPIPKTEESSKLPDENPLPCPK